MLDLVLIVVMALAGLGGYRMGFVARAASWVGLVVGIVVAARLMPRVIESIGETAGRSELVLIAAGLLLGGAAAGQALGVLIGSRVSGAVHAAGGRGVDAAAGAVAGVLGALVLVWLLVPALADMSGSPARAVRESRIVRTLTETLPPAPDATQTLRRLLGDGYPRVFDDIRPAPDVGPPPAETGFDQAGAESVAASIVKVVGEACGRIQEGTGFAIGDGLVVTNAHVIAGEERTVLERRDGARIDAVLVALDPVRDVAVLSAPELGAPALPLGDSAVGLSGAVFGHPGGGPLELSPFEVRDRLRAVGTDIYGRPGAARDVLILASDLAPGDSGSPLVTPDGVVVGLAFAIAPDRPGVAYAVSTDEVRAVVDRAGDTRISAGACAA